MNVLVTGGAGFIGSHTVDLLLREDLKVRILDSLTLPVHLNGKKPSYLKMLNLFWVKLQTKML